MSRAPSALPRVPDDQGALSACARSEILLGTALVQWASWRCLHDGPSLRAERTHEHHVLKIVAAGSCSVHDGGWSTLLDPATVILHRPGSAYRTEHPYGVRDRGWSIAFDDALAQDVLREAGIGERQWRRPTLTCGQRPLHPSYFCIDRLQAAVPSPLEREAFAIELLEQCAGTLRQNPRRRARTAAAHRRIVERVREAMQEREGRRLPLDRLSREVGASPAHLCRIFRAETGLTLRAYLRRLRLAEAFERGERGGWARAALDAGFSSQAHFSSTCRELLGCSPSQLRRWTPAYRARN